MLGLRKYISINSVSKFEYPIPKRQQLLGYINRDILR